MDNWGLSMMSDEELRSWLINHAADKVLFIAGIEELLRRSHRSVNLPAWIAIGVAVLSLFISILGVLR
jgi:hypothetical protein